MFDGAITVVREENYVVIEVGRSHTQTFLFSSCSWNYLLL